jgi:hypothetical protein
MRLGRSGDNGDNGGHRASYANPPDHFAAA